LLLDDGQPLFADESEDPPSLPSSLTSLDLGAEQQQAELVAAMLSIIVSMDKQLQVHERQMAGLKKLVRTQKG